MTSIIMACLYGALAAAVCVLMAYFTNKRLGVSHLEDKDNKTVKLYSLNVIYLLLLTALIAVSAATGYVVAKKAISWIAIIELSICYFAVLAAAIIDLKTKTIPNGISICLVAARVLIFFYEVLYVNAAIGYFVSSAIGAFLCIVVLIIANKISKGGIGGGDIKLLASVGFVCGMYVVVSSMLLALLACILISGLLMAFKKFSAKDDIPFGPFIYFGYLIVCLLTLY